MSERIDLVVTHHAREGDVYRLEVARMLIVEPEPDPDAEPDAPVPEPTRAVLEVRDFLFAADDARWKSKGRERPHDVIAAEQRAEVLAALTRPPDAPPSEARPPAPVVLPGVGDSLLADG